MKRRPPSDSGRSIDGPACANTGDVPVKYIARSGITADRFPVVRSAATGQGDPPVRLKGAGPNRTLLLVASIVAILVVIAVVYVLMLAPR
jgi:hypothetical protein